MDSSFFSKTQVCLIRGMLLVAAFFSSSVGFADLDEDSGPEGPAATSKVFLFDLPEGNAVNAFRQFSETSGTELLYTAEAVRGLRTPSVSGEYTPMQALRQMLKGTGLEVLLESEHGALVIRRADRPNVPRAPLPVVGGRPRGDRTDSGSGDELQELEGFTVTGSRLAYNSGQVPTQPVQIYTSQYIERLGAPTLAEAFQYIPAVTSITSGFSSETVTASAAFSGAAAGQVYSRTSAQLRSGSQNETLLLIDGQRVPLTGLRNPGGNGYDLGALPLSAIDRIEVLLEGASAIYGADAVSGVINVILKKNYSGTEVRLSYENTFDKDTSTVTANLTHGFASGKLSGLLTLSASENDFLLFADRRLTSTFDRTEFGGALDQSQPDLFVEGTGSISVRTGTLPGTDRSVVAIPPGYTGGPITVEDYLAAPEPVGGITPGRRSTINKAKDRAAFLRLAYEFNDFFNLTGSARISTRAFRNNGDWRDIQNVTIPAGYAGNPFDVPVLLSKTFYDLPPVVDGSETQSIDLRLTADGKLFRDWEYETTFSFVEGKSQMRPTLLEGADGQIAIATASTSVFNAALEEEIAAGRNPILIYDSNNPSPNAPGALDPFWVNRNGTRLNDEVRTWTLNAQVSGSIFTLPAGDIKTLFGFEGRMERVAFPDSVGGQVWPVIPERDVTAFFTEMRFPLLGEEQDIPAVYQLDFNLAARYENYNDFGSATTPRYGLAWRPVKSVLLRASYGEGFLAPQLYLTSQESRPITWPPFFTSLIFAGQVDFSRGDTPIAGELTALSGGNPNLGPQRSEHINVGIVVDVPVVEGLSLSFDYYENDIADAFGAISSLEDRQLFAPETIVRGEKLPDDPADWLGPIIGYDNRIINISSSRNSGYSYGIRYQKRTELGDLSINLVGESTLNLEERVLPESELTARVNERYQPDRITLNTTWAQDAWEVGITGVYGGRYFDESTNPDIVPDGYVGSVTRWDLSGAYDFGLLRNFGEKGDLWWKRLLHDSKLRVSILNVFDTEPPLTPNGTFRSTFIDPRLRRYVVEITKRF